MSRSKFIGNYISIVTSEEFKKTPFNEKLNVMDILTLTYPDVVQDSLFDEELLDRINGDCYNWPSLLPSDMLGVVEISKILNDAKQSSTDIWISNNFTVSENSYTEHEIYYLMKKSLSIGNKNIFTKNVISFQGHNICNISQDVFYRLIKHAIHLKAEKSLQLLLDFLPSVISKKEELLLLDALYSLIADKDLCSYAYIDDAYHKFISKVNVDFYYNDNIGFRCILNHILENNAYWVIGSLFNNAVDFSRIKQVSKFFVNAAHKLIEGTLDEIKEKQLFIFFEKLLTHVKPEQHDMFEVCSLILKNYNNPKLLNLFTVLENNKINPLLFVNDENKTVINVVLFNGTIEEKIIIFNGFYKQTIELKDDKNNNVFHELLLNSRFELFSSLIMKDLELLPLLFEENNYGMTPIDMIGKRKYDIEIDFTLFVLMPLIDDKNRETLKKISSFPERNRFSFNTDIRNEIVENDDIKQKMITTVGALVNNHKDAVNNFYKNNKHAYDIDDEDNADDQAPSYTIYSDEDLDKFSKHVEEFNESYLVNWVTKLKENSGKKLLATNEKLKNNLEDLRKVFPNFHEFIDYVEDSIYLNDMGDGHFFVTPSLLVSSPGIGKTFFLNSLAKAVGVDYNMFNMEAVTAGFVLVGSTASWKDAKPGLVFQNVFSSKYANNIFILDELDKTVNSNYPVDNVLLPLLETHTAKTFKDEFIPIPLDIRKIVWVATANDIDKIASATLSRFQVFKIPNPTFSERMILAEAIYKSLLTYHTWGNKFEKTLSDEVKIALCSDSNSSRDLSKIILKSCGKAAKRGDTKLIIDDLNLKNSSKVIELWDQRKENDL